VRTTDSAGFVVQVQEQDFDPGQVIEDLRKRSTGAIVSFVGIARDLSGDFAVDTITLEHYPGMTERSLEDLVARARARWPLLGARVIHRYGRLQPADRIVLVAVSSLHRDAAFESCRYLMDYLKTEAPFWKREAGAGGERWVDAKASDEQALARWQPDAT